MSARNAIAADPPRLATLGPRPPPAAFIESHQAPTPIAFPFQDAAEGGRGPIDPSPSNHPHRSIPIEPHRAHLIAGFFFHLSPALFFFVRWVPWDRGRPRPPLSKVTKPQHRLLFRFKMRPRAAAVPSIHPHRSIPIEPPGPFDRRFLLSPFARPFLLCPWRSLGPPLLSIPYRRN